MIADRLLNTGGKNRKIFKQNTLQYEQKSCNILRGELLHRVVDGRKGRGMKNEGDR